MLNGSPENGSDDVIDFEFGGRQGPLSLGTSDSDILRKQTLDAQRRENLVRMFLPDVRFAIDQACDNYLLLAKGLGPEIPDHSNDVTDTERILRNAVRRDALQEVLGSAVLLDARHDSDGAERRPLPWSYEEVRDVLAQRIAAHLAERQMGPLASDFATLDMNNAQAEAGTIMTRLFEHPAEDPVALIDAYFSQE